MAEEWKKLAYYDEVAVITDAAPEDVTVAAAAVGTSSEAARADHKHDIAVKLNELTSPDGDVAFATNKITGLGDPADAQDAATKKYVDGVATGLDLKESCRVATITTLPANTQAGAGVGATLSADADGVLTVDSVETALNDRILVKDQGTATENGIYKVTQVGAVDAKFILTRATDADLEVTAGLYTFIEEGTTLADQGWVLTTNDPITVDTTELTFGQFSSAGSTPAHKDTHDPEDGSDPLDCAAPAALLEVQAAGEGSAHTFARADHAHAIVHDITDNSLVTIDGTSNTPADNDIGVFTTLGLEGQTPAEVAATMALDDIGAPDALVAFAGQQATDLIVHVVADAANRPAEVLAKICYQTDDTHIYVCTGV